MANYAWPEFEKRKVIGKRISRLDGLDKSSGRAKYPSDMNPQGLLFGTLLVCPHGHARVRSIDTSAAEKMKGVTAVYVISGPGTEIQWAGTEVAAIAATSEELARDAALHKDAAGAGAALPRAGADRERALGDGQLEVRVGEHDDRVPAAHLEREDLPRLIEQRLLERAAHRPGAGEEDAVHARVKRQCAPKAGIRMNANGWPVTRWVRSGRAASRPADVPADHSLFSSLLR